MKVIAMTNFKGGVAKTTSVINISACLAEKGKRVLIVDFDPQGNTSIGLGYKKPDLTIYEALTGEAKLKPEKITDNLHIVPADIRLCNAEYQLINETAREKILDDTLQPLKRKYDYVFIDCPPSAGILTFNAMTAANYLLIPVQPEVFSIAGFAAITSISAKVKKRLNKKLKISGVFLTRYDKRISTHKQAKDTVIKYFNNAVFETTIRPCIQLSEAAGKGLDIFRYNNKSTGAQEYESLTMELMERLK